MLWVNWRESLSHSRLHYLTATADLPAGPFTLANANVTTRYADGGDFTVFADDDGAGYLLCVACRLYDLDRAYFVSSSPSSSSFCYCYQPIDNA